MFLSYIDFISPKIILYYKSKDIHFSILSGILSIIAYIVIFILSLFSILEFFKKSRPNIFLYSRLVDEAGKFSLDYSSAFHFINFGYEEIKTDYITIIGFPYDFEEFDFNNLYTKEHWLYEKWETSDAKGLEDTLKLEKDYTYLFKYGFCIKKLWKVKEKIYISNNDKTNFYYPELEHGSSNPNNKKYAVIVLKCRNNIGLNNNINCQKREIIDNFIQKYVDKEIFVSIIDNLVDALNYKKPIL